MPYDDSTPLTRSQGLAFLVRCADAEGRHWSGGIQYPADACPTCNGTNDAGWLGTPGSRYGRNARDCAPAVWRAALRYRRDTGDPITETLLDRLMARAVNDMAPIYR